MREYYDFDLTNYNSYRLKSVCQKAFFPESENDVLELYKNIKNFILLGSGHNVILSKSKYNEDFVIFNGNFNRTIIDLDGCLEIEAGASMLDVSEFAFRHGLSGLEIFYDIPSSLGGAVVMNAGAGGEEIKDVLTKVRYLDLADMTVKEILKDEISFEYRNSFFQKNTDKIVLKAWLQLVPKETEIIKQKMDTVKTQRWAKQPKEFPNAGSVFKRPKGYYVGAIMDDLGLKGYTVGGAKISDKHGGFIINFNNATGADIISLINHVKSRVLENYAVDLEIEQRII